MKKKDMDRRRGSRPHATETSPHTLSGSTIKADATSNEHPITNSNSQSNIGGSQNTSLQTRRQLVILNGFKFDKPSECSRVITKNFKEKINIEAYTGTKVPQATKTFYFEEFKKHYVWEPESEENVKRAWDLKASTRCTDLMRDLRAKPKKPSFITDETWLGFTTYWETPKYKEKREINTQNRLKGEGSSTHIGGSLSHIEHAQKLETILKCPPTEFELFLYTHTIGHDNQTFINEKSKTINDNMLRLRQEHEENLTSVEGESQPINESALYYQAAGGINKMGVYGCGSKSFDYYSNSVNNITAITSKSSSDMWENKYLAMERKVTKLTRKTDVIKQTLQVMCRHIGVPPLDFDTDREEDTDQVESTRDDHHNPNTSGTTGSEAGDLSASGDGE